MHVTPAAAVSKNEDGSLEVDDQEKQRENSGHLGEHRGVSHGAHSTGGKDSEIMGILTKNREQNNSLRARGKAQRRYRELQEEEAALANAHLVEQAREAKDEKAHELERVERQVRVVEQPVSPTADWAPTLLGSGRWACNTLCLGRSGFEEWLKV